MKHALWPNESMIANWPWNNNWRQPEEGSESILYEGEIRFSEEKTTISGSVWHDLMQWCKNFQYEPPKMKMQRENLIPDGSMQILTLKLALLGMVTPWRCQKHHRPGASSVSSSLCSLSPEINMSSYYVWFC